MAFIRLNSPERIRLFQKIAFDLGMDYYETDEKQLLPLLRGFKLFSVGTKKIFNLLSHVDDMHESDVSVFDYQYTVSTGKTTVTFRQTVFFMNSKLLGLPEMYMKPENLLHRIGHFFGFKDINFEAYPDFSRQYWLKGDDQDYIRYTMNEKVLEHFTSEKDWYMETVNYYFILYKHNVVFHPNSIKSFYLNGMKLFDMLKQENV